MKKKYIIINSANENSTLNTLTFTPKKKRALNIHLNKKEHPYNLCNVKKTINSRCQKEINDKKLMYKKKNNNFNNDNSLAKNYAKSLKFAFKHIYAINTQFDNYNKNNLVNKNNTYHFINNKMKYNSMNNSNNNSTIALRYITNNKNLNKLPFKEVNKKIIKIQTYYRYYFARKKLYNTFLLYAKLSNLFNIIMNKFIYYKYILIKNLPNISKLKIVPENTSIDINQLKKEKEYYEICNINNITLKQESHNNNDTLNEKRNIINYTVCNISNININNVKDDIKNKNILEDKKIYEEKIMQLVNENNIIREKNLQFQKNEDIYINIKLENEKLNQINNAINIEKNQLISELNTIKEKYQKLLNDKQKTPELNISKSLELEINVNKEKEASDVKDINQDSIKNTKIYGEKEREKQLKNLFKNKVFEMKDYIHKCFIKFYYNGIFLQMTGKLSHLKKKDKSENSELPEINNFSFISEKMSENENENNNVNIETEKSKKIATLIEEKKPEEKKEIEEEREKKEKKKRLQKSRGLRRLMAKKANERLETLRVNFYKFYRAGIVSKFRSVKKRKTCQVEGSVKFKLDSRDEPDDIIINKKSRMYSTKNLTKKEIDEKDELKEKIVKVLEKILFKADRRNMIILKKIFQKFYLKTKLESVQSIITNDKARKKKKRKIKKKSKSCKSISNSQTQEMKLNNDLNDIEEQINENEENIDEEGKKEI